MGLWSVQESKDLADLDKTCAAGGRKKEGEGEVRPNLNTRDPFIVFLMDYPVYDNGMSRDQRIRHVESIRPGGAKGPRSRASRDSMTTGTMTAGIPARGCFDGLVPALLPTGRRTNGSDEDHARWG